MVLDRKIKYVQYASRMVISPAAKIPTPCANLLGGVFEVDSTSKARRAASLKLRKYDARCCIIFMEGYRSGHNG